MVLWRDADREGEGELDLEAFLEEGGGGKQDGKHGRCVGISARNPWCGGVRGAGEGRGGSFL